MTCTTRDGVFAIAITLLVLELAVPAGSRGHLLTALGDQWPSYLAYIVSFASVGSMWVAHSAITDFIQGVDVLIRSLKLLLRLVVSLLPFATKLLAEYVHEKGAEETRSGRTSCALMRGMRTSAC
jgi:uncharacterized membrane protein